MFTSEPSLAQRIERMIGDTPVIDPYSHVRCDAPSTPDLASLLGDHRVQSELRSVGMPDADRDPALPGDERVRRSIPYLKKTRNTATSWCFYRILRDLFDFYDPDLTESNYREVLDRVEAAVKGPAWAHHVIRDRCNIRTVVTGLGNTSANPSKNPDWMLYRLDAHDLFVAKPDYCEALSQILGERPTTTEGLARLLHDWLDRAVTGDVRFTSTFLPIEQCFLPPDEARAQFVLTRLNDHRDVPDADIGSLVRFVMWQVLGWHHEKRKAVQIAVGAEPLVRDGKSISRHDPTWTSETARAFHHFGNARFDLMIASELATDEATRFARQFPNVYVSGYAWHNFSPGMIEKIVGRRVQTTPMTKVVGFLSDASSVEWSYARFQVVKKAMASAFAKLVETGYFEEDEVPPILKQVLHDTPRDLYNLGPR